MCNTGCKLRVRYQGQAQPYASKAGVDGFSVGDTVGVCWDSKKGSLEFYHNGKSLGVAFDELDTTIKYRAAVSAIGTARVTIAAPMPTRITWHSSSMSTNFARTGDNVISKISTAKSTCVSDNVFQKGVHKWTVAFKPKSARAGPGSPASQVAASLSAANFIGVVDASKDIKTAGVQERGVATLGYALSTTGHSFALGKSKVYTPTPPKHQETRSQPFWIWTREFFATLSMALTAVLHLQTSQALSAPPSLWTRWTQNASSPAIRPAQGCPLLPKQRGRRSGRF